MCVQVLLFRLLLFYESLSLVWESKASLLLMLTIFL